MFDGPTIPPVLKYPKKWSKVYSMLRNIEFENDKIDMKNDHLVPEGHWCPTNFPEMSL